MTWKEKRVQRYQVEIYKKFSIAIACLVFMLIGAPLGLSIRRGGLATIGAVALGIFMFYWVTLVQGEKLADRGLLPPWVGMWIANVLSVVVGTWLVVYVVKDLRATPPLRRRLWEWLQSTVGSDAESPSPPATGPDDPPDEQQRAGPSSDPPGADPKSDAADRQLPVER
jgi:lipopolysaccharide export system permease protein